MSDDDKPRPDDETQPVRPEGAADLPPTPATAVSPTNDGAAAAPAAAPVARRGFRERFRSLQSSDGNRAYSLGALIASALAGIIVGGLGVTAVHALTHDGPGERGGWVQRRDDRGPGFGGDGGMHGDPRGVPGQVPPTTAPEDDDSSTS